MEIPPGPPPRIHRRTKLPFFLGLFSGILLSAAAATFCYFRLYFNLRTYLPGPTIPFVIPPGEPGYDIQQRMQEPELWVGISQDLTYEARAYCEDKNWRFDPLILATGNQAEANFVLGINAYLTLSELEDIQKLHHHLQGKLGDIHHSYVDEIFSHYPEQHGADERN